jgi:very-short-patch-repair endonuclease
MHALDFGEMTYRKPKQWRAPWGAMVIGDPPIVLPKPARTKNKAHENAKIRRSQPTSAEGTFAKILDELGGGALKRRYVREWAFADKWILDFYFDEVRLGIEVDGSIHAMKEQRLRDRAKEQACRDWHITLLRISNQEVFGRRAHVVEKLLRAWAQAKRQYAASPYPRVKQSRTSPGLTPKPLEPINTRGVSVGGRYRFTCTACGLAATVSDSDDYGFVARTRTFYCRKCETLIDIAIRDRDVEPSDGRHDKGDGYLHCPRCNSTTLKSWSTGAPCPKCGGEVTRET